MAIQNRRGANADFDSTKMLPGELAVTTDGTRKVYVAFAPGDTKELASAEEVEESIQNGIEEIEQKKEKALAEFPNYEEQLIELETYKANSIITTSSGQVIHETDCAAVSPVNIKLFGKGKQRQYEGNQLLDLTNAKGGTNGDITVTVNDDLSVTYKGTATDHNCNVWLLGNYGEDQPALFTLQAGTYSYNGVLLCHNTTVYSEKFTITEETSITAIRARKITLGETYDETVYPMLNEGDTLKPWEPYVGGEQSPNMNYPQKAEFLGESGSIECGLGAENYCVSNTDFTTEDKGITKTKYKGKSKIRLQGIVNEQSYPITMEINGGWEVINKNAKLIPAGTKLYVFPANLSFDLYDFHNNKALYFTGETTVDEDFYIDDAFVRFESGYFPNGMIDETIEFMLTDSLQPFTALTPNGLRGIDDVSDYRDYSVGKTVQRIQKIVCDENSNISDISIYSSNEVHALYRINAGNAKQSGKIMCSHMPNSQMVWGDVFGCAIIESNAIDFSVPYDVLGITKDATRDEKVSALKTWISQNEALEFYVELAEPIKTDLTSEELAEYNALVMNYPNITIVNAAGAYMEVTHVKDTQKHIEQNYVSKAMHEEHESRIAELEKAIVNS